MRGVCIDCGMPAECHTPEPRCHADAKRFYAAIVAVGAATARIHREHPGLVLVVDVTDRVSPPEPPPVLDYGWTPCRRCGARFHRKGPCATLCHACLSVSARRTALAKQVRMGRCACGRTFMGMPNRKRCDRCLTERILEHQRRRTR